MSTEVAVVSNNLPATYEDEAEALLEGTESHETFLKFRKGKYFIRKDEVSLGFECIAHPYAYQLGWIKFENDKVTERIMGRKADRFVPPQREELSEPHDAWAFVHELPLEDEGGQVLCFTTSTKGGLIAIEQLIKAYWHRLKSRGSRALPIIKLATAEMSTKDYGVVPRPAFDIVGWDDNHPVSATQAALDNTIVIEPADTPPATDDFGIPWRRPD